MNENIAYMVFYGKLLNCSKTHIDKKRI